MATLASDTYRRPAFGPTDELFYRCLATSAILGAVFLVAVLLAPIRREAITSIEQLPTRFARLIVEKPVEPVALPPADVVRPGDTKAPGEVGPKGGTNTPEAASGPEPGPGPTDVAPGGGGTGTAPGPNGNGAAGRARAQKIVSAQLAGATASLDRTLSSLSTSLQGVVATPGAGPARRTRSVRAARGADQLGSVDTDLHTGGGADLGGSAVAGSWVAIGSLSGTGGSGTGGGSGGGVGDGTGSGSGSGLGGGGGGGGNGGYPGTGGGVGGGSGSGGGGGGAAPGVYRSNASLLAVIQKYTAGIQYCYGNELKRDATLRGKLVVAITVAASGEVTEATVLQNTLGSERLSSCALSQIRDWKFPPIPMGLTTFRAPFVFTPPN